MTDSGGIRTTPEASHCHRPYSNITGGMNIERKLSLTVHRVCKFFGGDVTYFTFVNFHSAAGHGEHQGISRGSRPL